MKDQDLVITDKAIFFKDNERSIVMDSASQKLMEMYAYIVCQNKGDVLDIGFGMGYSAQKMWELADSYTCIEVNPVIYKRASKWAEDKLNVNIIFGDWFEIIPQLGLQFDGIFMDTHDDPNYNKFEQTAKLAAKEGCILSIFNYFTQRTPSTMNFYEYNLDPDKFSKVVSPVHTINWTHYSNNEWIKSSSNKINFPEPTSLL